MIISLSVLDAQGVAQGVALEVGCVAARQGTDEQSVG